MLYILTTIKKECHDKLSFNILINQVLNIIHYNNNEHFYVPRIDPSALPKLSYLILTKISDGSMIIISFFSSVVVQNEAWEGTGRDLSPRGWPPEPGSYNKTYHVYKSLKSALPIRKTIPNSKIISASSKFITNLFNQIEDMTHQSYNVYEKVEINWFYLCLFKKCNSCKDPSISV